jgi:flagellar basal body-associated protein FliL
MKIKENDSRHIAREVLKSSYKALKRGIPASGITQRESTDDKGTGMLTRRADDSGRTMIIIIVILVAVAVLLLGGLMTLVILRSRRKQQKPQGEEVVAQSSSTSKPARKWPWTRSAPVDKKTAEEEKELRDAVKMMMIANAVPLSAKPEEQKDKKRLRLDAKSATETFAANALANDSQFSHFVNFTSSKFQVESSTGGGKEKEEEGDAYLF